MIAGFWFLLKHWILSSRTVRCKKYFVYLIEKKSLFAIFCIQRFKKKKLHSIYGISLFCTNQNCRYDGWLQHQPRKKKKKKKKVAKSALIFCSSYNPTLRFCVCVSRIDVHCSRTRHHTETRKTHWRPCAAFQKVWPNTTLDVYTVVKALLIQVGLKSTPAYSP